MEASRHSKIACALIALAAPLIFGPAPARAQAAPGEVVVTFERSAGPAERSAARSEADVTLERSLAGPRTQLLRAKPGQSVGAAVAELERSGVVANAEPNYLRRISSLPNDPLLNNLWGASNPSDSDIDLPEAWATTTGSPGAAAAVIDTGVDANHVDLRSQLRLNPGESGGGRETNGRDDDGNGLVDDVRGWDFVDDDNLPNDANGHGTHVAGIIAAEGGNGTGIAGVSPGSRVMPLRVLDSDGSGTVADLIAAYRYAASQGIRVVNASLGGTGFSTAERDAIAAAPNTLFVVAAGNGGSDAIGDNVDERPEYPCAYDLPNVVCVAASDQNDNLARFSNYGARSVDLAAPGTGILSTVPGGYDFYDGTSMATPYVTGVALLLLSANPASSVAAMKAKLLGGVDRKPAFAGRTVSGGRLNAARALSTSYVDPPVRRPPTVQPRTAAPARCTKPRLKAAARQSRRAVLARGLIVRLSCNAPARLSLRLFSAASGSSRGRPSRAVGARRVMVAPRSRRVAIRLSRAARAAIRARRLRTLTAAVTTAGDGVASVRVRLNR